MKKGLVKLLGIVLCAGLLTGCGKEQEVVQRNVATEESKQTEGDKQTEKEPETKTIEDEQVQSVKEEQSTEGNDDSEQESNQSEPDTVFHIDDTVIFDEEGVTVTLKDFSYDKMESSYYLDSEDDFDTYYYKVNVVNNNPDNRKVSFRICDVSLNGFSARISPYTFNEILVGDSEEYDGKKITDNTYRIALGVFRERLNRFPIETVGIYYYIQIGSDSEWKHGQTFIKTSNYKDSNWEKLYGDKIYEEDMTAESSDYQDKMGNISVYLRDGIDDIYRDGIAVKCITVLNSGDLELKFTDISIVINGEVDREHCNANWIGNTPMLKGEYIVFLIDTPKNIRRNMELSNDELLDVSLQFTLIDENGTTYDYEVNIPQE